MSGDGHHITQPAPSGQGAALAMSRSFDGSGVKPRDVAYVNAHATSTPLGMKFWVFSQNSENGYCHCCIQLYSDDTTGKPTYLAQLKIILQVDNDGRKL